MNAEQLADLLIGIAKSQAAILTAVERKLDKSATHEVRQALQQINHASLTRGADKIPITFENLPTKLLEAALAPGSVAGREIRSTALSEVTRLLFSSD